MARKSKTPAATTTKTPKTKKATTPKKAPAAATATSAPTEAATPATTPTTKKLSALDAAARVLAETGVPMSTRELIEAMATRGYWTSPGGATPHATLAAAIGREIATKGAAARFQKTGKGRFAATTVATATTDTTPTTATPVEPATETTPEPTPKPARKSTKKKATPVEKPVDGTEGPESIRELFRI